MNKFSILFERIKTGNNCPLVENPSSQTPLALFAVLGVFKFNKNLPNIEVCLSCFGQYKTRDVIGFDGGQLETIDPNFVRCTLALKIRFLVRTRSLNTDMFFFGFRKFLEGIP